MQVGAVTDLDEQTQIASLRQMAALQARVCYMNVDRTLATWSRTALALIVLGILTDRFGLLLLGNHPVHIGTWLAPNPESSAGGAVLVALGIFIAVTTAIRHQHYRAMWMRIYGRDASFGPWLAFAFAVLVAIIGAAILAVLLLLAK